MTREETNNELQRRCNGLKNPNHVLEVALQMQKEIFDSLEQQNTELQKERANMQATHQSTIESYRKEVAELQARIKELQEPKTCASCKYLTANSDCRIRRVCTLEYGTIDMGIIEVKETFFCSYYAPKQNHVH